MECLFNFEFWIGILSILGFIWVLTSFGKFIANCFGNEE